MKTQHIFIVGMMGTGKTSIGKKLAKRLSYAWFDTDQLLEEEWGYSIDTFFQKHGEAAFRQAEQEILMKLVDKHPAVITTGGGIVLNPANCRLMLQNGQVISLTAHPDELIRRLQYDQSRPLLKGNVKEKVWKLATERAEKYQFADLMIDTTKKKIADVVEEAYLYLFNSPPQRSS